MIPIERRSWHPASLYEIRLPVWYCDNKKQLFNTQENLHVRGFPLSIDPIGPYKATRRVGDNYHEVLMPVMPWHRVDRFLRFVRERDQVHFGAVDVNPPNPMFDDILVRIDLDLMALGAHEEEESLIGCKCCVPGIQIPVRRTNYRIGDYIVMRVTAHDTRTSPVVAPSSTASSSCDTSATALRASPTPPNLAVHADSVVDLPPDLRLRAKRGADDISVNN